MLIPMNFGKCVVRIGAAVAVTGALMTSGALSASASDTHWVGTPDVFTTKSDGHSYALAYGYIIGSKVVSSVPGCDPHTDDCHLTWHSKERLKLTKANGQVLFNVVVPTAQSWALEALMTEQEQKHHSRWQVPSLTWVKKSLSRVQKMSLREAWDFGLNLTNKNNDGSEG
jgi:hypothetical protein